MNAIDPTNSKIYHLSPASYFQQQPKDQAYLPPTFEEEGFIHCTQGVTMLLDVANRYFATLAEPLLAIEVNPDKLTAPLKFEPPTRPPDAQPTSASPSDTLFPHIYGPLNRDAIVAVIELKRDNAEQWIF